MTAANGSLKLIGYSADEGNGVVFAVLKPVLAGSVITVTGEDIGLGAAAASWTWTASKNLAPGSKVTFQGLTGGDLSSDAGSVARADADPEVTGSSGPVSGSSTNPTLLEGATSQDGVPAVSARSASSAPQSATQPATLLQMSAGAPSAAATDALLAPSATNEAPVFGDGDENYTNSELVLGGVAMRGGNDTLTNSGTIVASDGAAIDMGDGDDRVLLEENSQVYGSILLGNGNDQLSAPDVVDDLVIDAGAGDDTVLSGLGDDRLVGGAGNDLLDGNEGDDALQGGEGDDRLIGGSGDDLLFGEAGNDTLVGGEGNDLLDGGAGVDTVDYSTETGDMTIDLGTGRASGGDAGSDRLVGIENAIGGSGDDILVGNAQANVLDGRDGDDRLVVGAGDTALGGAGDDLIDVRTGPGSVAAIDGGQDDDTVELTGTGTGTLGAATNVENLIVRGGSWSVAGSAGYDSIAIENGGTVTSGLIIDNDDRVSIAAGGRLTVPTNAVTWAGGGDAVLTNAGLIEMGVGGRLLQTAAPASGTLTIDNVAGGTLRGALSPTVAGAADAAIVINNAGTIEAAGRVMDFRAFDTNGGQATINNLAGGVIRQSGTNTDVLRPGQDGTVNNAGTITTDAAFVGGGDLIDFQDDTGGRVNNLTGGVLEGARHVVTGDRAVTVVNDGIMIARNGSAVNIDNDGTEADRVSITNRGTMQGRSAALDNSDGDAIDVDGLVSLLNYGTIEGLGANGANDGEPNVSEGIAIGGGQILNYGQNAKIYGYGRAIQVDNSGNQTALGATFVNNEGLIEGGGNGPEGVSPEAAARFDLRGNEAINLVGDFADEILNQSSGRIMGGVSMGGGNDRMNNSGRITATGGSAIDMGAGNDSLQLYVGAIVEGDILLGAGDDLVFATSSAAFDIDGGDGNDEFYLGDGSDSVLGGSGNDRVYSSAGNDVVDGGAGDDDLNGEGGDDTILGGSGNDVIAGGAGNDTIDAGEGDDVIKAGLGNDTVDGGDGYDTLDLSAATGALFVDMGSGRVSGSGIGVQTFTSIENVGFGDGNNVVTGGNGDDNFDGGAGNDALNGGAGDDVLLGNVGNDALTGGSGDDELDGGIGNDTLSAGSGDDSVFGGAGNDTLRAGSGDDQIDGGAGDDALEGGSGSDTFIFAAGFGRDSIADFGVSDPDTVSFEDDLFADFAAMIGSSAQVGDDVVITVDGANSLTLLGTDLSSLSADDFRYA